MSFLILLGHLNIAGKDAFYDIEQMPMCIAPTLRQHRFVFTSGTHSTPYPTAFEQIRVTHYTFFLNS